MKPADPRHSSRGASVRSAVGGHPVRLLQPPNGGGTAEAWGVSPRSGDRDANLPPRDPPAPPPPRAPPAVAAARDRGETPPGADSPGYRNLARSAGSEGR